MKTKQKSDAVIREEEQARRIRTAWCHHRLSELMYAQLELEDGLDRVNSDDTEAAYPLARAASRLGSLVEAMRADMGLPQ